MSSRRRRLLQLGCSSSSFKEKMNPEDVYKVHEIRAMAGYPREEHAQKILEEVARQVQPIMIKHKWTVNFLTEFDARKLLGLNRDDHGEVRLRLRNLYEEGKFIPFEVIIDTMLHELCHYVHGPHHPPFTQLLDKLHKEYEELVNTGIIKASSKEFDLRGPRLAERLRDTKKYDDYGWLSLYDLIGYKVDYAFWRLETFIMSSTRVVRISDLKRAKHIENRLQSRSRKHASRQSTRNLR